MLNNFYMKHTPTVYIPLLKFDFTFIMICVFFSYLTSVTQCVPFCRFGSRSPCANATSHQLMANSSQLLTNVVVKMTNVKRHLRSTSVVKTSCRNLPCSRMFLCAKLHEPFLAMKRALFTRSLNTGLRGMREASPGRPNSSGMMLFLANILRCFWWSRKRRQKQFFFF